jgi:alpha-D-xyloside xylohydrolase
MAETLRGGLSLSASGFGFFSHDIGGFEAEASPDVYKRWCAFGLMSTHSRLHGSSSYRVPWLYEEDTPDNPENACAVLRFFTKLKGRLMPYLFAQGVKTSQTGVPMMRAMVIDYSDDPVCLYLDRQYMLGDSLLCAPVFSSDKTAEFYLPKGRWTDIITGETYNGGKYVRRSCSYLEMPVLAAPNSIVVFGNFKDNFEYDYAESCNAVIYNLEDGKTASASVYSTEAVKVLEISASRKGSTVEIEYSGGISEFTVSINETKTSVRLKACKKGRTVIEVDNI